MNSRLLHSNRGWLVGGGKKGGEGGWGRGQSTWEGCWEVTHLQETTGCGALLQRSVDRLSGRLHANWNFRLFSCEEGCRRGFCSAPLDRSNKLGSAALHRPIWDGGLVSARSLPDVPGGTRRKALGSTEYGREGWCGLSLNAAWGRECVCAGIWVSVRLLTLKVCSSFAGCHNGAWLAWVCQPF